MISNCKADPLKINYFANVWLLSVENYRKSLSLPLGSATLQYR